MVSRESVTGVVLPTNKDCLAYLREQRWPEEVTCPRCESAHTIKKGTTRKGTQRYRCHRCNSIFNDLTDTVFAGHQLSLPEMFHIIRGIEEQTIRSIAQELDRTYKTTLDFVHEIQDTLDDDPEFDISSICKTNEIDVLADEA